MKNVAIIVLALFAGVPLIVAQTATVPATAPAPPAPPATAPARALSLPASLEAFESADIYAKDAGYVTELKADIGDHVKQGQLLATIDDPELKNQLSIAEATLATRKELVKAADATIKQAQSAREVVRSQVASYQAELDLAQATLKRQQELFEAKAATDQQLDESRAKAKVAEAQVGVAQAKMAAADADLAAAEAGKAVTAAQEKAAVADVDRLQTLIQYTRITAPFDGVVTRRMVSRGDLVQSGASNRATPLFTCQRIDTIRVFCDVPQSSASAIAVGTNASIRILGLESAPVKATVTRIGYALNASTRTMRVEIDLPNAKEELRAGMYAEVTLTLPNP